MVSPLLGREKEVLDRTTEKTGWERTLFFLFSYTSNICNQTREVVSIHTYLIILVKQEKASLSIFSSLLPTSNFSRPWKADIVLDIIANI